MPAVAPPPYPIPEPVVSQCVATASRTYGVPELVIRSILGTRKTGAFVSLVVGLSTAAGMLYGAL